jgi:hypothetical protein
MPFEAPLSPLELPVDSAPTALIWVFTSFNILSISIEVICAIWHSETEV